MGVKGLQFYLETCCWSASPEVSISELVERRRQRFPDREIVIVVDGLNCINKLYGDLEWIGGGQLKQYADQANSFVQAFKDIGVELVFFFDGPTEEKKRNTWVERRMSKLGSIYFVLDEIDKGTSSHCISSKEHFNLPPGLGHLSHLIFEKVCGCKVYQSITECDKEIVRYARTHRAFAILGQDTDYVILETGYTLYLSMLHINLQQMTTRHYDRVELARILNLHPSQLPVLATVMGNDIIPAQDLKRFHVGITSHGKRQHMQNQWINYKKLVPALARYVRSLPVDRQRLNEMSPEISRRVLGHPSRAQDIRESLSSYDPEPLYNYEREDRGRNSPWSKLVTEARLRHQTNKIPSVVYAIIKGLPFESSTSIEDYRKNDIPTFARATGPLRKRLYGILLKEKPLPQSGVHEVDEWCMDGPGSLDRARKVEALPPQDSHPGLLALWSNCSNLSTVRWHLFVQSVSPNIDVDRVRNLPPYLVIPTLTLFYINELRCLEEWEINAMLGTATTLKHYDVTMLSSLPADPMTTRGIRVANLIMRSTFVLYALLAACGYPLTSEESAAWLFFDGKLFHSKYRQANNGDGHERLCDHKVDSLEEFQLARQIIFRDL